MTHFLSYVEDDSSLRELFRHVCSVNLTPPGHYFAFDEALEQFGVSFVKQNIRGKLVDSNDLRQQISSVQAEKDHLTLLVSEYVGDMVLVKENQAVKKHCGN